MTNLKKELGYKLALKPYAVLSILAAILLVVLTYYWTNPVIGNLTNNYALSQMKSNIQLVEKYNAPENISRIAGKTISKLERFVNFYTNEDSDYNAAFIPNLYMIRDIFQDDLDLRLLNMRLLNRENFSTAINKFISDNSKVNDTTLESYNALIKNVDLYSPLNILYTPFEIGLATDDPEYADVAQQLYEATIDNDIISLVDGKYQINQAVYQFNKDYSISNKPTQNSIDIIAFLPAVDGYKEYEGFTNVGVIEAFLAVDKYHIDFFVFAFIICFVLVLLFKAPYENAKEVIDAKVEELTAKFNEATTEFETARDQQLAAQISYANTQLIEFEELKEETTDRLAVLSFNETELLKELTEMNADTSKQEKLYNLVKRAEILNQSITPALDFISLASELQKAEEWSQSCQVAFDTATSNYNWATTNLQNIQDASQKLKNYETQDKETLSNLQKDENNGIRNKSASKIDMENAEKRLNSSTRKVNTIRKQFHEYKQNLLPEDLALYEKLYADYIQINSLGGLAGLKQGLDSFEEFFATREKEIQDSINSMKSTKAQLQKDLMFVSQEIAAIEEQRQNAIDELIGLGIDYSEYQTEAKDSVEIAKDDLNVADIKLNAVCYKVEKLDDELYLAQSSVSYHLNRTSVFDATPIKNLVDKYNEDKARSQEDDNAEEAGDDNDENQVQAQSKSKDVTTTATA